MTIENNGTTPVGLPKSVGGNAFDLGSRLRRARETAKLSQRQLAVRAEVSNTMISLIEQNRTSPSVGSLQRILDALPISLAEFFEDSRQDRKERVFFHKSELATLDSDTILTRRIPQDAGNGNIRVYHSFFRPGADSGEQSLAPGEKISGFVVRGTLDVTADTMRGALGSGDAFHFENQSLYRFRNTESIECEVVITSTSEKVI